MLSLSMQNNLTPNPQERKAEEKHDVWRVGWAVQEGTWMRGTHTGSGAANQRDPTEHTRLETWRRGTTPPSLPLLCSVDSPAESEGHTKEMKPSGELSTEPRVSMTKTL